MCRWALRHPATTRRDLELSGSSGKTTVVPVVLRSLVPLGGGGGSFSGTITGGNGNGFIGREDTFAFDVPRGAPAANVSVRLPNDPNTQLLGFLVSPDGQAIGQQASVQKNSGVIDDGHLPSRAAAGALDVRDRDAQPRRRHDDRRPVHRYRVTDAAAGELHRRAEQPTDGDPEGRAGDREGPGHQPRPHGHERVRRPAAYGADVLLAAVARSGDGADAAALRRCSARRSSIVPTQTDLLLAAAHGSAPITFDWGFVELWRPRRAVHNPVTSRPPVRHL